MSTVVAKSFSVKPLVAAVALAMSAGHVLAAPPAGALPGMGVLIAVDVPATTTLSTTGLYCMGTAPVCGGAATVGQQIWNGSTFPVFPTAVPSIILNSAAPGGRAVIQWGGNTYNALTGPNAETKNAAGFNVGKNATLVFTANQSNGAILNIDNSGSLSEIYGQLVANDLAGFVPSLYVANTNGIVVGPNASIAVPQGIGLIGASMTGATAINDFVRNNSTGGSFINITTGQAKVEVNGSITGDLLNPAPVFNQPATFVLLAGGDVVNTGNVFGSFVEVFAGMRAAPTKAIVNLVPNTIVNRAWDTDAQFYEMGTTGIAANGLEIATATSSFVNTGSVSVDGGYLLSMTAGGMRSGVQGNTDQSVGIFADNGLFVLNYSTGSKVELYNSVKGYSINKVLPFLQINSDGNAQPNGTHGDVFIEALTPGTLPSSITTTDWVTIFGENVTVNSTINHKLNSAGGVQNERDLLIDVTKNVTINKSIGAGGDVVIFGAGNIATAKGANILSDTNKSGSGGIFIVNNSNTGGSTTTIDGNLDTSTSSGDDIQVIHNGISTAKVVINGNVTTHQGGDILVWSDGGIDLSGVFLGSDDVSITALGQSAVLKGPITADVDGPGNGFIAYAAPFAQTKLYPTAVLSAPNVLLGFADNPTPLIQSLLGGWLGTNSIAGVNATGGQYAKAADKPAVQILTNNLTAVLFGSLNAPIAGNSDWLQNGMQIDALDPTVPLAMSLSAMGAGPQYINIASKADVFVDSGLTVTPFFAVGLTSGTAFPVGPLVGNGGSSLILNATGALNVVSNSGAQGSTGWIGGPGFHTGMGGNAFFEFPGGVAMKSGDLLTTFVPMYNAWTETALPYQGFWFEAPKIDLLSYFATQGNARVNVSTAPLGGMPNIYVINRVSPDSFGFDIKFDRGFFNTYSKAITGTPINNCPIGFVC
jgi:filamentous hemagglutinin family protein